MKPERILRKHRLGANVSDRRIARAAYDDAVAMRAGKAPSEVSWGPVAKAMCISALLHPKPSALVGCADASVQGLKYTEDALRNRGQTTIFTGQEPGTDHDRNRGQEPGTDHDIHRGGIRIRSRLVPRAQVTI